MKKRIWFYVVRNFPIPGVDFPIPGTGTVRYKGRKVITEYIVIHSKNIYGLGDMTESGRVTVSPRMSREHAQRFLKKMTAVTEVMDS